MAASKRKGLPGAATADSESSTANKKLKHETDIFEPKPMPNGRSLLLELPAELRDIVYEMVLEDSSHSQLSRNTSKRNVAVGTSLVRVNKQIKEEFLDIVLLRAPVIETSVRNFEFGHIIAFLNRLSAAEIDQMSKQDGTAGLPAKRSMHIKLFFSCYSGFCGGPIKLQRWLNRMEHPTKKGTKIECSYEVDLSNLLHDFNRDLRDYNFDAVRWTLARAHASGPRGQEHLVKIMKVFGR